MHTLRLALLLLCVALPSERATAARLDVPAAPSPLARVQTLPPMQMDEVLWLARCIYSESNRADEQRYVAWVVRNRVETGFGGTTYREVVLKYKQFSAFNTPTDRRTHLLALDQHTTAPAWQQAVGIALDVYQDEAKVRPFSKTVRHFYSPISMQPRNRVPGWAAGRAPLSSAELGVDPQRFLFFDGIDMSFEGDDEVRTASERITVQQTERQARSSSRIGRRKLRPSGAVARPARPSVSGVSGASRTARPTLDR